MSEPVHAIVGATALVGPELERVPDAIVVVRGKTITEVGTRADVTVPEGARTFDATGSTLIPGFIDAHVHIDFYEPSEVVDRGVTTVRDLAWPPARITPLIEASADDGFDGPTILAAGQMLTAPGGYPMNAGWAPPGTGLEVQSEEQAAGAVDDQVRSGAAIVKIALNPPVGPVLNEPTLCAIVEAAHDRDLKVTGHIFGLEQLDKAIRCGVDELAHMLMSPERIPAGTIDAMVEGGIRIVPTLSVFSGRGMRIAIDNLRAFISAGGQVIYGTDLGNAGPQPGIDRREVRGMARSGMSAQDIIRAATVDSAAWLGLQRSGQIAEGMDADLVLLGGDPLREVKDLTAVEKVWRRGRVRGS